MSVCGFETTADAVKCGKIHISILSIHFSFSGDIRSFKRWTTRASMKQRNNSCSRWNLSKVPQHRRHDKRQNANAMRRAYEGNGERKREKKCSLFLCYLVKMNTTVYLSISECHVHVLQFVPILCSIRLRFCVRSVGGPRLCLCEYDDMNMYVVYGHHISTSASHRYCKYIECLFWFSNPVW